MLDAQIYVKVLACLAKGSTDSVQSLLNTSIVQHLVGSSMID